MKEEKGKVVEAEEKIEEIAVANQEEGRQESEPTKEEIAKVDFKSNKENKSNKNIAVITLSSLALILGAGGLALGWLGYEKASTPITFLNNGTDGNSASDRDQTKKRVTL